VVLFQVKVFWVVTPCSTVVGYQRFIGLSCLHLHTTKTRNHLCTVKFAYNEINTNGKVYFSGVHTFSKYIPCYFAFKTYILLYMSG
jgi:hypothetical protein